MNKKTKATTEEKSIQQLISEKKLQNEALKKILQKIKKDRPINY
ncbi:hypothetical protein [Flammeovirga aprica]|nr:hypothetical protein [Flammeovirga aprica]